MIGGGGRVKQVRLTIEAGFDPEASLIMWRGAAFLLPAASHNGSLYDSWKYLWTLDGERQAYTYGNNWVRIDAIRP